MAFTLLWPTQYGTITQHFAENPDEYGKFGLPGHEGIDFKAPEGSEIFAAADGFVSDVRLDGFNDPMLKPYGNQVRIKHDGGYETIYAHLSQVMVTRGQYVIAKQLIALAGNTGHSKGAHLHFGLKKKDATQNGETGFPYDLVDPEPYVESFKDEGARQPTPPDEPTVTLDVASDGFLNVRTAPYLGAGLSDQIPNGASVGSLEPLDRTHVKVGVTGQWLWIRTEDGLEGYVAAWYLKFPDDVAIPEDKLLRAYLVVVDSGEDRLKLREGPGTQYDVIARFETGTVLKVLESEQAVKSKIGKKDEWLYVYAPGEKIGYCAAWYLKIDPSSGQPIVPEPPVGEPTTHVVVKSPGSGLKVRSGPGTEFSRLWSVPHETVLYSLEEPQVTGDKVAKRDKWIHVRTPSLHSGYVAAWYVRHPTQPDTRVKANPLDVPVGVSPHIFGIHAVSISDDPGAQQRIRQLYDGTGKQGWVMFTEICGRHPHTIHPVSEINNRFWQWANQGFGVIVRLNHGYEPGGTVPVSAYYDDFAEAAARWVEVFLKDDNRGRDYTWTIQIGNEQNNPREHPGGSKNPEEYITPTKYAEAFNKTYHKIKAVLPNATVCPGAVDPYNYMPMRKLGNTRWAPLDYFSEMMDKIEELDGVILHAYTHGLNLDYVTHLKQFGDGSGPLWDHYYDFQIYRTFMERIPAKWRRLPVYITEINHIHRPGGEHELGWENLNIGFIREVYEEIDRWNNSPYTQQIRCGLIYRWTGDHWKIADKGEILTDFRMALENDRRWRKLPEDDLFSFSPGSAQPPYDMGRGEMQERRLVKPDDLTKLWGLGPNAAGILNAAGIFLYDQLANTTPERLMVIVGESELRARYIRTWPEQARLAVAHEWDKLEHFLDDIP